jgi:hypothetical protein
VRMQDNIRKILCFPNTSLLGKKAFSNPETTTKCVVREFRPGCWLVVADGQPVDGFYSSKRMAKYAASYWTGHQDFLRERLKTCRLIEERLELEGESR